MGDIRAIAPVKEQAVWARVWAEMDPGDDVGIREAVKKAVELPPPPKLFHSQAFLCFLEPRDVY